MMRCALTRWALSTSSDRRRPLPGWAARHVGACADCQARAQRLFAAEAALADSAAAPAPRLPARRLVPARLLWAGTVAVAAAAIVLLAVTGARSTAPRARARTDRKAAVAETAAPARTSAAVPGAHSSRRSPTAAHAGAAPWSAAASQLSSLPSPLRTEAQALASDAGHGLRRALAVTSFR